MYKKTIIFVGLLVLAISAMTLMSEEEGQGSDSDLQAQYGSLKRIPWTSSRVKGSPDPPNPFRPEVVFPQLRFEKPLELTSGIGTKRLFVVEQAGKIFSFVNDPKTAEAELLIDLKKETYGLALHPNFKENGYFYVTYILDTKRPSPKGTRLSRFQVQSENPLSASFDTEKIILEWPSGGHNAGCLRFGPDGYLYVAAGDGSGIADELDTGQDITDLLASILRIDVDHPDSVKNYGIPNDNPFVTMKGSRPEIWAYGLRQVWKMSFDRKTGDLWAGEVGQDLWEMINLIQPGGNYGWSVKEGTHPVRPTRKLGPTPILEPIIEHDHSDFRSITGGFVYRGKRLPELAGHYVSGDYDTGRIWGFQYDGKQVKSHRELVDTSFRVIDFGETNEGEIYVLDYVSGKIYQLVPAPPVHQPNPFPLRLSETGLFTSTEDYQTAPGLIPYSVNSELWSDGAIKDRWLALPEDSQIELDKIEYPQPAPAANLGWRFPDGTVIVKTFSLELEPGNPATRKRVETRLLHFERLTGTDLVGDQYWKGYSYVWNDDQTDAELVGSRGLNINYKITDTKAAKGYRDQEWRIPSRAECTLCHTTSAKYVLGVNTLQMNKHHNYGFVKNNQLEMLHKLAVFKDPLPAPASKMSRLADYSDKSLPIDIRARAYLHSNCSHCHRKWGGGNADFQLLVTIPLEKTEILKELPTHGDFDIAGAKLLSPGEPDRSLILYRMMKLGLGRMPHIASNVPDEEAIKLIRTWISNLPSEMSSRK